MGNVYFFFSVMTGGGGEEGNPGQQRKKSWSAAESLITTTLHNFNLCWDSSSCVGFSTKFQRGPKKIRITIFPNEQA
jgi:hypothetical protein